MTDKQFWQARLDATRLPGSNRQYDVTCTWTDEQRANDTGSIAAEVRKAMPEAKRLVDFGAGRGRFGPVVVRDWGCEYLGVEILGDLVEEIQERGFDSFLYEGEPIPEEIDGDGALFCLVIQHLERPDALHALTATRAKRLVIVDGIEKTHAYGIARAEQEYVSLLADAGCEHVGVSIFSTPLVNCYKVVTGIRADA